MFPKRKKEDEVKPRPMWTSHGHRIPGSPDTGQERPPAARCSGILGCPVCKEFVKPGPYEPRS